jgi:hypothetical protein
MRRWWLFAILAACACPAKQTGKPGAGSGSAVAHTPPPSNVTGCAGARAHVAELYAGNEDNVAMAMADCAKDPAKIAPCMASAASLAALEQTCLIPIDDDGTEGEKR